MHATRRGARSPLQGRRLVVTGRTPAVRREITIFTTAAGRVASYQELVFAGSAGHDAHATEAVIAALDSNGAVRGRCTA